MGLATWGRLKCARLAFSSAIISFSFATLDLRQRALRSAQVAAGGLFLVVFGMNACPKFNSAVDG